MSPRHQAMPRRFWALRATRLLGHDLLVAETAPSRLLGLALLPEPPEIGGLLIPRCRSVHTFGMRFDLRIVFIDAAGRPLADLRRVGRRRIVRFPGAKAVVEIPLVATEDRPHRAEGGEVERPRES